MQPHRHATFIKAWADGARIQRLILRNGENINEPIISESWVDENTPMWSIHEKYRVKPDEPQKRHLHIYNNMVTGTSWLTGTRYQKEHENLRSCIYMGSMEVDYDPL